ncbi:hypothetical protein [Magnetospirillum sulfuroxidans]|uniref:Uncharacterized protein n=1 Tax=Magnetospirillum sulfuroxidans TaxID=611300 RepID=A0ABS5IAV3_9PROT|nr:hypothetical protein [Magnetospirillum sulfuroxidans]MBR9971292.1 hypothetical protein [Magnetospirillum sulfuroxidans]
MAALVALLIGAANDLVSPLFSFSAEVVIGLSLLSGGLVIVGGLGRNGLGRNGLGPAAVVKPLLRCARGSSVCCLVTMILTVAAMGHWTVLHQPQGGGLAAALPAAVTIQHGLGITEICLVDDDYQVSGGAD